jgi:hypothetical protein
MGGRPCFRFFTLCVVFDYRLLSTTRGLMGSSLWTNDQKMAAIWCGRVGFNGVYYPSSCFTIRSTFFSYQSTNISCLASFIWVIVHFNRYDYVLLRHCTTFDGGLRLDLLPNNRALSIMVGGPIAKRWLH